MAQNTTVKLDIASVGTAKTTKDVKSLKEQIKDLRKEIEGLDQTTEEYNTKVNKLGNLMHTQQEITEAARLATDDYGATLSNITSITNGVVGSLSAMNGVMSLIGASSDESLEAIRKMQSLMSIIAGLNQLDQAEKAFKGLWTRIKLTTTARQNDTQETIKNTASATANASATNIDAAAKRKDAVASGAATAANTTLATSFRNLGLAMKSFMMSNPFTLIIMGLTTAISLMSAFRDRTDDAKKEMGKLADRAREFSKEMANEYIGGTGPSTEEMLKVGEERYKKLRERYGDNIMIPPDGSGEEENLKKRDEYLKEKLKELEEGSREYLEVQKKIYQNDQMIQYGRLAWLKKREDIIKKMIENGHKLSDEDQESIANMADNQRKLLTNLYKIWTGYEADKKKVEDNESEKNKKAAEDRRARELNDLKTAYERQKLLTNDLYRDQELTAEEYYNRQIAELNGYLEKWTKLRIKHNKELGKRGLTDGLTNDDLLEIERMNSQAVDLERKKTEAIIELRKKLADNENYRGPRSVVDESRYQNAQNALIDQEGGRYAEQQEELFNAWWLKKFMLIEQYDKQEVEKEREHNDELNRLAMERYAEEERVLQENFDADKGYEDTRFQNEMDALEARHEAKLISEQDYYLELERLEREHQEKMDELQADYDGGRNEIEANRIQTLRDIAEQRYQIEKDYYDRRLELDEAYISAYQTLSSSIGGILAKVQEQYAEGSKQYERIQEASIIMDTVSGALSAFMSGVRSGIPAPGNIIYGGVLSALALAEGQLALNNLHSKRLSAGASNAPSVSAYQVVAQETNAELSGQIADTRVFVTETDISDTLTRVNVIESESTF